MIAFMVATACLCATGPSGAHPLDPRYHDAVGDTVAVGAASVTSPTGFYVGLLEFYVHTVGVAIAHRDPSGTDATPAAVAEPWVAAMFYPFANEKNLTTYKTVAPTKVALDPAAGGTVSFSMTGLGSIAMTFANPTGAPVTQNFAFTTPEGHHGHRWFMAGVIREGVRPIVTGTITKAGKVVSRIIPLSFAGQHLAFIGEQAFITIESS